MLELSFRRYSTYLFLQLFFLLVDLLINSYSYLAKKDKVAIIFLFLSQDICLILSLVTFFFGLYSTYVYQAGLVELMYSKFRAPIAALIVYFILTVSYHVCVVTTFTSKKPQWTDGLTALWFIQRLFSPVYYYLYKKSALCMSDPRFYENLEWVDERLAIK